jgi:hypothetical protein
MAIKRYFISPLPPVFLFCFKIRKFTLEEILSSGQHLCSWRVTFILFILSKLMAGTVNCMVYVTIVFPSCVSGLQIFVKSGLTDFKVTVFYCRQGSSLKQLAGMWGNLFRDAVFTGRLILRPCVCMFWGDLSHDIHR